MGTRITEFEDKIERNTVKYAREARSFAEQYLEEIDSLRNFLEVHKKR